MGNAQRGMTHIIIRAVITGHDNAPAAKLQGEKNRWIEHWGGCVWQDGFDRWECKGIDGCDRCCGCV